MSCRRKPASKKPFEIVQLTIKIQSERLMNKDLKSQKRSPRAFFSYGKGDTLAVKRRRQLWRYFLSLTGYQNHLPRVLKIPKEPSCTMINRKDNWSKVVQIYRRCRFTPLLLSFNSLCAFNWQIIGLEFSYWWAIYKSSNTFNNAHRRYFAKLSPPAGSKHSSTVCRSVGCFITSRERISCPKKNQLLDW